MKAAILVIFILVCAIYAAQAQTPTCPAGFYPGLGSTVTTVVCLPIPSVQPPPPVYYPPPQPYYPPPYPYEYPHPDWQHH